MNAADSAPDHLLDYLRSHRPEALGADQLVDIMAEFTTSYDRLSGLQPAVSFFGSARIGSGDPAWETARHTAELLSCAGFAIISGGGPGMMEAVSRGAQAGGSPSVGLNIVLPGRREPPNAFQDISLHFHHFFVRKAIFMHFASAFVVLPGGYGTLDELLDCVTLMQTEKARRIPVILVEGSFWGGLVDWFRDSLLARGTIAGKDLDRFLVLDHPEEVREAILRFGVEGQVSEGASERTGGGERTQ